MATYLETIFFYRKAAFLYLFFFISATNIILADEYHYKNVLVGDRAATMGGAYVAVSDDSSGAYYNPAGIAFAYGDSVSGSGNAYHSTNTQYKKAIGNNDWERDSTTILPNFFGMIKKFGSLTASISYIVPDSLIEHQDQLYTVNNAEVSKYYISLHSEDQTNMLGPSIAYKLSDSLAIGIGLFYSYRIYRHEQEQFLVLIDGNAESLYSSVKLEEYSYVTKLGFQLSPFDPFFIGLNITYTTLDSRKVTSDNAAIIENTDGELVYALTNTIYTEDKKYPIQVSLGVAMFPTPSILLSMDIDHFAAGESYLKDITNYALGGEWFINAANAIRLGYFTNYDARQECTSTSCSVAKIDMTGFTLGYSSYTRTSSFTLGAVSSTGAGKADIYGDGTIVDMNRQSFTLVFAANYNY